MQNGFLSFLKCPSTTVSFLQLKSGLWKSDQNTQKNIPD
jgi:hypothetical protein